MKKLITLFTFLSISAFADTYTLTIEGMHCGSCAKAIAAKICKNDQFKSCDVSVGKAIITTEKGVSINNEEITALIAKAGDYKVKEIKADK